MNILLLILSILFFYLSGFYISFTLRRFKENLKHGTSLAHYYYGDMWNNPILIYLNLISCFLSYFPLSKLLDWKWYFLLIASYIITKVIIELFVSLTGIYLILYPLNKIFSVRLLVTIWIICIVIGFVLYFLA